MATMKTVCEETCEVCGSPVKIMKMVRSAHSKANKMLTGMVWVCDNGHKSRTRIHTTKEIKVG